MNRIPTPEQKKELLREIAKMLRAKEVDLLNLRIRHLKTICDDVAKEIDNIKDVVEGLNTTLLDMEKERQEMAFIMANKPENNVANR